MRKSKFFIPILLRTAVILVAALCVCHAASGEEMLSFPSGTVEGRLSNGLRYIILDNTTPSGRVEFRLVVEVGSLDETPKERGAAHFVEHLAFGDTKHFPERKVVEYIESQGVKFGEGINAYTGYDRTVYMFTLPSIAEGAIDTGLLIMRDWIEGIKIGRRNVEGERGIITEEIRAYDVGDDFYSLKIGDGVHSKGFPIGTSAEVTRLNDRTLRKFYKRCYSPSRSTVIVVGDIYSAKEVESKIISVFSSLKGKETSSVAPNSLPLYYSQGVHLMEVRDSLRESTILDLMIPHPTIVQRTVEDAILKEKSRLLVASVSERFRSCGIRADVSDRWYLADKDHFSLSLRAASREELLQNVTDAAGVLSSIVRDGFDEEEIEDVRRAFCSKLLNSDYRFRERSSSDLCEDFTDYAVSGDRYVCDTMQNRLVAEEVAKTDNAFLQARLAEYLSLSRKTFLVAVSSHPVLGTPLTEEEISSAWERGLSSESGKYGYAGKKENGTSGNAAEIAETSSCLSERHPFEKSMILSCKEYQGIEVRDITLSNGIRLILKPSEGADSTLYVSSFFPFGTLSERDSTLVGYLGYMDGGIERVEEEGLLYDYMYESGIAVNMTVENNWYGFMAMSPSERSLELFNLLYEKSFAPAMPEWDFPEEDNEEEGMLSKMLKRDVSRQISSRIAFLMGDFTPSLQNGEGVTAKELYGLYRRLYSVTDGQTFVVCGNFDEEKLIEDFVSIFGRADRYGIELSESKRFEFPRGNKVELFRSDTPSRSDFNYLFYGYYEPSLKGSLTLKLMRDLIRNRLISVLRERDALVYSPYISLFYNGFPYGKFYFDIEASADSRNMSLTDKELRAIIETLCREEVLEQELQTIKKSFLLAKDETLSDGNPSAWREVLSTLVKNGEALGDFDLYGKILSSITPSDVREAFDKWIIKDSSVLLVAQESPVFLNINDYE